MEKKTMEKENKATENDGMSFWLSHINSSNIYHTITKGTNPWARSHGFTQPIQLTRGAYQYYQNIYPNSSKYNIEVPEPQTEEDNKNEDEEMYTMNYGPSKKEIKDKLKKKIFNQLNRNVWLGFRLLKLKLGKEKTNVPEMNREEFKEYMRSIGIILNDIDIDDIFKLFGEGKDKLCPWDILNQLREVDRNRMLMIEMFKDQSKPDGLLHISFEYLKSIVMMKFLPKTVKCNRNPDDIFNDYCLSWDDLRDGDKIYEIPFREYFLDISPCIDLDADFVQCLNALGYKYH